MMIIVIVSDHDDGDRDSTVMTIMMIIVTMM